MTALLSARTETKKKKKKSIYIGGTPEEAVKGWLTYVRKENI